MKTKLFLVAAFSTLLFSSCAKKSDNTPGGSSATYDDSYTINGGVFHNVVYNMTSVSQQTSNYDATAGITTIAIKGLSGDSVYVQYDITFQGNSAKSYTLASTGNNVFTLSNTNVKTNALEVYTSNSGAKLTVSSYGGTGSPVIGTFSGSFNNTLNNYTISSGTFKATVQ